MCIRGFRKTYIEQAVGGEWDVKGLMGGTEERAATQSVPSTWLRKTGDKKVFKGHVARRRGDESFGDHVNWETTYVSAKVNRSVKTNKEYTNTRLQCLCSLIRYVFPPS
jgi:hypothetical protein